MKRILLIILILLLTTYNISFAGGLNLSGEAAILIDGDTGQVLFQKNSDVKLYPASTTKIMTGILAIELGNMEDIVVVDDEVVELTDGSHIALEPGERLSFEDMLHALLIQSANDAALAIGKHISGDIDEFVALMNEKAKELGALDTHFVNPNGLPHDEHMTTAHDLGLISKYAMQNPKFREVVGNYNYQIPISNKKDEERYLNSNNRLLFSSMRIDLDGERIPIKYEGATGVKTGYTQAAQSCLVASATRDGRDLIAVILKANGKEVFSDAHKLLNYGFGHYTRVSLANREQFVDDVKVANGVAPTVPGIIEDELVLCIPKDSADRIEEVVSLNGSNEAPIERGQALGTIKYYLGEELLGEANIISNTSLKKTMSSKLKDKLQSRWFKLAALLAILASIRFYMVSRRRRLRRKRRKSIYRMDGHIR